MENNTASSEKVLYVDDVRANLMLFEASFESDFTLQLAESGEEALKLLEKNDFSVVVSDQNMPGISGTELLEIVAQKYPEIMRFMITAYTDYSTVVDSINKGQVFGYFNKPYNIDEVRRTINNSLEIRNLRMKNQEMILKLERANVELVEMDKTKIDFLSGITNEIRNPINKIMTAVHMIKDRVNSKELTESLHLLDLSLGRLESFSESAKLLVRFGDNSNELKHESVSLKELIEVGIIEKRDFLRASALSFKVVDSSGGKKADGEFDLLQSCLLILMDLVISHSEIESEILFSIEESGDKISLGIKNSQSNFAQKEIDILSVLFSDEKVSFKRENKLEWVLAHHIIDSHKGEIQVSFDDNKSTLIQMILPVSAS
jgi:CheY-like chemotaxis protein